jgi:hypothetical protein
VSPRHTTLGFSTGSVCGAHGSAAVATRCAGILGTMLTVSGDDRIFPPDGNHARSRRHRIGPTGLVRGVGLAGNQARRQQARDYGMPSPVGVSRPSPIYRSTGPSATFSGPRNSRWGGQTRKAAETLDSGPKKGLEIARFDAVFGRFSPCLGRFGAHNGPQQPSSAAPDMKGSNPQALPIEEGPVADEYDDMFASIGRSADGP